MAVIDCVDVPPYHRVVDYPRSAPPLILADTGRALVMAARPKQWTKNLLVYLALFFTVGDAWSVNDPGSLMPLLGRATLAFLIFSALSAGIYLVNDIIDAERDRLHPRKRLRPIASGRLSVSAAWAASLLVVPGCVAAAFVLEPVFGVASLTYAVIMVAYTFLLKRLVLVDVLAIAAGFVLRVVAGAAVLEVPISPWLYICTGLGALFIALSKRRAELALAGGAAAGQRDTLGSYTQGLLDQLIAVVATSVVLSYSLYTFTAENTPDNHSMMLTIPFVVYALFRYMYLVHTRDLGENPEDVLITDAPLIATVLAWLATAGAILVIFRA